MSSPPFIITTRDHELSTLVEALAAIDAAANTRCDAVKLGMWQLPWDWCAALFQHADDRGVVLLARPDDEAAVARLDWVGAHAFDIPFDLCDLELVANAARTGKPIVMSVGRASLPELAEIVEIVKHHGNGGIALIVPVHCDDDLGTIDALQQLGATLGVSDASSDPRHALAAIARGASIVEKRRADPAALSHLIRDCEIAWASLALGVSWATN